MSTTRITIVKVAGRLGVYIRQLVQHWLEVPRNSDLLEKPPLTLHKQGKTISDRILSLSYILESHCDCASIVWYQQFVDAWTIAPCLLAIDDFETLSGQVRVVRSESIDVIMLTATDRDVSRCLRDIIVNCHNYRDYSSERRYFLKQMRQCAISWQSFLESNDITTTKLVFFHALGPSRIDHDVISAAEIIPEWFQEETEKWGTA
jgi:hypothetical protein